MMRRINGVKTVSSGAVNRQIPQAEFVATLRRYQQDAAARAGDPPEVVAGLWRSEGFSTTFGKYRLPDNTLNDPAIPRESLGISHVGYGAASTEYTLFDQAKLLEIGATKCNPHYRGLYIEGIGSILRIYEPGIFKIMCGLLGLIPKGAPPGPDKAGFFAGFMQAFSAEEQRLITHGYGRLVAFSKFSVYKAIGEALELPEPRVYPCIQGIAFAFYMMNSPELPRILENSASLEDPKVRRPFQNGLVYALVFTEWFAPGFLAALRPAGKTEERLIVRAREEAAGSLRRGYTLAFDLENPL
jgi:hypothetical protein